MRNNINNGFSLDVFVTYQLISSLETFIRQIKYVSSDIKTRMHQIEMLSMLTLCENDHLPNELCSGKFNSTPATGSPVNEHQHCLTSGVVGAAAAATAVAVAITDVNENEQSTKSVTFALEEQHRVPLIASYFSIIHDNQHRKMKDVENLFTAIGPILIKLESLVLDTSTGELDNMRLYYSYWENELFELLIRYFELLTCICSCSIWVAVCFA